MASMFVRMYQVKKGNENISGHSSAHCQSGGINWSGLEATSASLAPTSLGSWDRVLSEEGKTLEEGPWVRELEQVSEEELSGLSAFTVKIKGLPTTTRTGTTCKRTYYPWKNLHYLGEDLHYRWKVLLLPVIGLVLPLRSGRSSLRPPEVVVVNVGERLLGSPVLQSTDVEGDFASRWCSVDVSTWYNRGRQQGTVLSSQSPG